MTKGTNGWERAVAAEYLPHLTTELHSLSTPVVLLGCGSWCPLTQLESSGHQILGIFKRLFCHRPPLQTHGSLAQVRAIRRRLRELRSVPSIVICEKIPLENCLLEQGHREKPRKTLLTATTGRGEVGLDEATGR